jgi:DNA-binding transcriptional regulator YdaS (Cro superfamily)
MTPADLRAICDSLNDERGTGGQTKLARLLGWHHSTVWRKLNSKSKISRSDELAIGRAVEKAGIPANALRDGLRR